MNMNVPEFLQSPRNLTIIALILGFLLYLCYSRNSTVRYDYHRMKRSTTATVNCSSVPHWGPSQCASYPGSASGRI